jgi:hypothetical protein
VQHLLSELKFEIGRPTESIGISYIIAKDRHIDEEQAGRHFSSVWNDHPADDKKCLPTKDDQFVIGSSTDH